MSVRSLVKGAVLSWLSSVAIAAERPFDPAEFLAGLQGDGGAFHSLAVSEDRTIVIGGPRGVAILDGVSGALKVRWPEAVSQVWVSNDGAVWAQQESPSDLSLLRWRHGAGQPDRVPFETAASSEHPLLTATSQRMIVGDEPLALVETLGAVQDGRGVHWRLDPNNGAIWQRVARDAWQEVGMMPAAIGTVMELAADPDSGVWVVGTRGVASYAPGTSARVLFVESVRDRMPAWLLIVFGLSPFALLLTTIGALLFIAESARGVRVWSLLEAGMAIGVFSGSQLAIAAPLWVLGVDLLNSIPALCGVFLGACLAVSAFIAWRLHTRRLSWRELGLIPGPITQQIGWALVAAVLVWVTVPALTFVCQLLAIPKQLYQQDWIHSLAPGNLWESLILILTICLAAPLVEELVFRGFVLRSIRERVGPGWALAVSSLLFGVAHGQAMILTTGIGLIFGWVASHRQSIVPTLIAHVLINAMSMALLLSGVVTPE
jgi:membrane protease YdiL (CAAX protease family)